MTRQNAGRWQVPPAVLRSNLSGESKLAFLWLWDKSGGPGVVDCTLVEMAEAFGRATERSARRWVEALETGGWIVRRDAPRGRLLVEVKNPADVEAAASRRRIRSAKTGSE